MFSPWIKLKAMFLLFTWNKISLTKVYLEKVRFYQGSSQNVAEPSKQMLGIYLLILVTGAGCQSIFEICLVISRLLSKRCFYRASKYAKPFQGQRMATLVNYSKWILNPTWRSRPAFSTPVHSGGVMWKRAETTHKDPRSKVPSMISTIIYDQDPLLKALGVLTWQWASGSAW